VGNFQPFLLGILSPFFTLFREMAIDPFFKNHSAFQFVLCQGDLLLAHTDIFSDQLHPDNITEQQHTEKKLMQKLRIYGNLILSHFNPSPWNVTSTTTF